MEYELGLLICLVLAAFLAIALWRMFREAEQRAEAAEADMKALAAKARKADEYLRLSRQAWVQINERDDRIAELRRALRKKDTVLEQYRKQLEREAS